MPSIAARGLTFEYEQFGPVSGEPLLLVMGLGAQMISWDEGFCEALAGRGFRVTRYDNRDVGLSSRLDELGVPDVLEVAQGAVPPAYTIDDMADDAAALLDALRLAPAHVVGASMGGYIAQALTIRHPEHVRSLTSIMSGPGGADATPPTPEAVAVLLAPAPRGRAALIESGVEASRVLWGGHFDETRARHRRTLAVDRAVSIEGTARQLGACLAQPSRVEALGRVTVPTLVVHGDADPLVPHPEGARTAAAVPGARLLTMPGVGHDLPPEVWDEVADAIAATAARANPTARRGRR